MKKADLEKLEAVLMEEVVKRRQLGGYSTEAAGLLLFGEALMRVVQHLIQEYPPEPYVGDLPIKKTKGGK